MASPCVTFRMEDPKPRGVPNPRYFKPLVRINAQAQDAPWNWKLDPCYIDQAPIVQAVLAQVNQAPNQNLTIDGNTLGITGGNTVQLPSGASFTLGVQPSVNLDASIPTSQVGGDAFGLGAPDAWIQVTVGGQTFVVPGYLQALAS
jgi:hypothetical protein